MVNMLNWVLLDQNVLFFKDIHPKNDSLKIYNTLMIFAVFRPFLTGGVIALSLDGIHAPR